jgi:hypothetical protein
MSADMWLHHAWGVASAVSTTGEVVLLELESGGFSAIQLLNQDTV